MKGKMLFVGIVAMLIFVFAADGEGLDEVKSKQSVQGSHYKLMGSVGIPRLMNYQGFLADAGGNPVTDIVSMTFSIWDAASGGSQLWSETQSSVAVNNGLFSVLLGSVTSIPNSVFNGDPRWLQTQVGSDILSPRTQIVSVGYAFYADRAGHADTADYSIYADSSGVAGFSHDAAHADTAGHAVHADSSYYSTYADSAGVTGSVAYADSAGVAAHAHDADMVDGQHATDFLSTANDWGRLGVSTALYEGTTALSDKYLGILGKAADADKLDDHDSDYFATSTHNHDAEYVNEGQSNSITSAMIQNGTIQEDDLSFALGDITAVNAGDGLDGGGTSGDVILTVNVTDFAGDGLGEDTKKANDLKVNTGTGLTITSDAVKLAAGYETGSAYDARFVNEGQTNSITSDMITNGQIVNADISGTAAISPSKISGRAWTSTNDGAGSGLDADMVDGQHSSEFADSDHQHDERYYTEAELNTNDGTVNQAGDPVSWNKIKDMPAGFADGTDNVGSASGGGWVDDGSVVRLETASDNVGIGTASPDLKLHVYGGPGSRALLVIGEGISGGERGLDIGYHYDGDYSYFQSAHQGTGFTPIALNPEGGNVGIGTTSPISKLEVNLDKQFELSPTGDGFGVGIALPGVGTQGYGNYGPGLYFSKINSGRRMGAISSVQTSSDADQGGLAFFVHSGSSSNDILVEGMRIDHSGNVGIGTAGPTNLLELSSTAPKLYFNRENSTSNLSGLYWRSTGDDFEGAFVRNNSSGDMELYTNITGGTPRMVVTNAGDVGIGTTGPAAKLDVRGDLYVTGAYRGDIASSSGSDGAPFPRPAYDSGWEWVGQGGSVTMNHNIGGDVANYFVDLWFKDTGTGEIHNQRYGGSNYGGGFNDFSGACWTDLTNAHIKVFRGTDDTDCNYVRVRIWVYN